VAILRIVLEGALSKIAADEIRAWAPTIANCVLRRAVAGLPEELRERYAEEWAADLVDYPEGAAKCIRASGFLLAVARIRWSNATDKLRHLAAKWIVRSLARSYFKLTLWAARASSKRMQVLAVKMRSETDCSRVERLKKKRNVELRNALNVLKCVVACVKIAVIANAAGISLGE
jgi:hypothetical protein